MKYIISEELLEDVVGVLKVFGDEGAEEIVSRLESLPAYKVEETLEKWEKIFFANEVEFIKMFCPGAWMLTQVSWSANCVKFIYVLEDGSHVIDVVTIDRWYAFLKKCG